jgi:hypothetical protein
MSYKLADIGALLNDIREQSRKALAERLLARVPQGIRNQLVAGVNKYVRDLSEAQLVSAHALLDHQEAPRIPPPDPAGEMRTL